MKKSILLFTIAFIIPLLSISQDFVKLSGIVTDAHSGAYIANADVVIENEETGTITNSKGAYVLYLTKGEYEVVYSKKGYEKHTMAINLTKDFVQLVELSQKNNAINNNTVYAGWSLFNKNKAEELTMTDD